MYRKTHSKQKTMGKPLYLFKIRRRSVNSMIGERIICVCVCVLRPQTTPPLHPPKKTKSKNKLVFQYPLLINIFCGSYQKRQKGCLNAMPSVSVLISRLKWRSVIDPGSRKCETDRMFATQQTLVNLTEAIIHLIYKSFYGKEHTHTHTHVSQKVCTYVCPPLLNVSTQSVAKLCRFNFILA